MRVETFANRKAMANAAARRFSDLAQQAVARRGRFSVALSGGSTPLDLYRTLARAPYSNGVHWQRVHFFWGDERCVPADHPRSNYKMVRESLLKHVPVPFEQVHRIAGEAAPGDAAKAYEAGLRDFFQAGEPRFDLVLLGMGSDGHTASLLPGSKAVELEVKAAQQRWVTANFAEKEGAWRVTLTTVPINAAAVVVFLVAGEEKASTLKAVLEGPRQPLRLPAQLIRPAKGELIWMVDEAAAGLLAERSAV